MFNFVQLSSLEKVFLKYKCPKKEFTKISALKNEKVSYQIAYTSDMFSKSDFEITVLSDLNKYISLRKVGNVPSELPCYPQKDLTDDDYLTKSPGLFPDPLYPMENDEVEVIGNTYHSIWVTVNLDENVTAGMHEINIVFKNKEEKIVKTMNIEIIDAVLPPQKLIVTQWFHGDCIASYYKLKMFSKKHWNWIDKFIKTASENGINMILTPIFTPPLDTKVGEERPTIQLVDISVDEVGKYSFDFSNLRKWVLLCKKNNIKYFEMAHFFTQWGAYFTPKIVANVNGKSTRIFGWDVEATSDKYKDFLNAFIPKLLEFLKEEKIDDVTYFHISDEPIREHTESYRSAKNIVKELLNGYTIIDALSDYEFFKNGLVEHPVPGTNEIKDFLGNVENLWAYYCCSQGNKVSNRFFAMPSYRNRIIGTQLYKYNIKGFLQWGYNFYYSQYSKYNINPFVTTDSINAFPSGDPFSVYPGEKEVIESLRIVNFNEALQDIRAMELLEEYIGKDKVVELIDKKAKMNIEFDSYPKSADYILSLRESINKMIKEHIAT